MIDLADIWVKAGNGGNGCIGFRREKFVPRGGPDGGDGGHGGSIYIMGDSSLNTLLHLKYHSKWNAGRGGHGGGKNRSGRNGEDITIPVPLGTVVWRASGGEKKEYIGDITHEDAVIVCQGGAGGYGNARFASSVQQEPRLAQRGEEGEKGGGGREEGKGKRRGEEKGKKRRREKREGGGGEGKEKKGGEGKKREEKGRKRKERGKEEEEEGKEREGGGEIN